jgi:hypothetical protein
MSEGFMGKRLNVFGVAIAAMVLLVGVVTPAVGASIGKDRQRTIRMDSFVTEVNFVDVAPGGASLGDQIVFSEKLLDRGKQIGHEGAVCTIVSLALKHNEAQRIATFSFPDGEITVQGLVILDSTAPYAGPITGGSGKYQGAAGELHVTPVSATQGIQTLHLKNS